MVAAAAALLFVLVRLISVGDGDIGSFVGAGDLLSADASLPLESGAGYDGQFYYRMASSPLDFESTSNGVSLDSEVRLQRIGYPAVTWALTLGAILPVTFGLVAVNIIGLGVIAGLGGVLAARHDRSPWWGLALASYYEFGQTLLWLLSELLIQHHLGCSRRILSQAFQSQLHVDLNVKVQPPRVQDGQ
ncbi:MAG: hypothetical protein ACKOJC_07130 [Actinomycetota bacterium]